MERVKKSVSVPCCLSSRLTPTTQRWFQVLKIAKLIVWFAAQYLHQFRFVFKKPKTLHMILNTVFMTTESVSEWLSSDGYHSFTQLFCCCCFAGYMP